MRGGCKQFFLQARSVLIECLRTKVDLDYPVKGVSKRQHLELVWESTGKLPRELEEPEIPERYLRLWDLYWEIRTGEPITYQELRAFIELSGEQLSPWEVEQIRFMDSIVRDQIAKKERPKSDEGKENGRHENTNS